MIILASQSSSRQVMLTNAGVGFIPCPAAVDERAIEAEMAQAMPAEIALALARAKALAVSRANTEPAKTEPWVLGSDSLVEVAGRRFNKPRSKAEAADHLAFFSGKTMHLHSAAALARGGHTYWDYADHAELKVRHLSEAFITDYLDMEWPAVSSCVGVFRIEGPGIQLFESITGSHFTVLGLPLLPVLAALRARGELTA